MGPIYLNPLKYAIGSAVAAGVPENTITLLLLLPAVATLIATTRHLIGLRGFGIFLPAALSLVFLATGPLVGIGLFLIIVGITTASRFLLRRIIKLQYLPRMALIIWFVALGVLGILFLAPILRLPDLTSVSIFPVLILALLAEDFTKVQLGKSAATAVTLTSETLVLALVSYVFLILKPIQAYAVSHPEIFLLIILVINLILGKYAGLRLLEYWRFRKLIQG